MRKTLVTLVLLFVSPGVAVAGGGGHSDSICPGYARGTTITMLDSCYEGTAHFAPAGVKLVVRNDGYIPHTFTAVDGSFDSGLVSRGETFELTVDRAGIYELFCTLHGTASGLGMAGVLIVGDPVPTAFAAEQDYAALARAIAEGDETVLAALGRHERTLLNLTTAQDSLKSAIDGRLLASGESAAAPAPVADASRSDASGPWLALISGLALGVAVTALTLRRSFRQLKPMRTEALEEVAAR